MPIATASRTRLGPWGVPMERYGVFTGKTEDAGPAYEVVRWRGESDSTVAWLGRSETNVAWRGESDSADALSGDV